MYCTCINCPGILKKRRGEPVSVSYFRFPKNEKLARKWVIFSGRNRNYNYKNARLCSLHFKPEDIIFSKAREMGFATKGTKLRPGAVPCLNTEEDIEREKKHFENLMKEKRKKMVDDIIKNSTESDLHEPLVPITTVKTTQSDPMSIDTENVTTKTMKDLKLDEIYVDNLYNKIRPISFTHINENNQNENVRVIGSMCNKSNKAIKLKSSKESLTDILSLQKDFDILLERNKFSKNGEKLRIILDMKKEYEKLFDRNVASRKKRCEHVERIKELSTQIEDYKIQKNHLKEQLENCEHLDVEKLRPKRLWTKIEVETAFEIFMKSHREYTERCKTECLPSIATLQLFRRMQHPNKKRGKYTLYCIEDTVERGVKNLGFEMETFEPKYEPLLPNIVETSGRYIFPEETKERGVADLLTKQTLALNNIVLYESIME